MTQVQIRDAGVNSVRPAIGEFFAMGLAAILLRVLLLVAAAIVFHKSFHSFTQVSDGPSYIAYARAMLGDRNILTDYDRRVFIGYPLVIAAVHLLGVPWDLAAMGSTWIAAGIATVMAAIVTRSRRVGWAMVGLTPHFLLYSSVAMNESLLLACCVGGLELALKGIEPDSRSIKNGWICLLLGGLVLGFGGVVRPFACFAVAGFLVHAIRQRRWGAAVIVAVTAAAVVGAGALGLYLVTGDALQGIKVYRDNPGAYHGELYAWPFKSLIIHSLHGNVPKAKLIYVWAYVLVNLAAVAMLTSRLLKTRNQKRERIDLFWMWLTGNTTAILCIGSIWGFEAFHRFSSWALPAELFALLPILPRRIWTWSVVTVESFAIALYSIHRN